MMFIACVSKMQRPIILQEIFYALIFAKSLHVFWDFHLEMNNCLCSILWSNLVSSSVAWITQNLMSLFCSKG